MEMPIEQLSEKLIQLFREMKDLQRIVIRMKIGKGNREAAASNWEILAKKVSAQWDGGTALDEIRSQRSKA